MDVQKLSQASIDALVANIPDHKLHKDLGIEIDFFALIGSCKLAISTVNYILILIQDHRPEVFRSIVQKAGVIMAQAETVMGLKERT